MRLKDIIKEIPSDLFNFLSKSLNSDYKELQGNSLHDILKNAVFFLTLNSIKWHNGEFSINQSFKLMNYDS